MSTIETRPESLVGAEVTGYDVLGVERDKNQQWIGADMMIHVPPFGRFFLNIVTKQHFAESYLQEALDTDIESLEAIVHGSGDAMETREPFVVNDEFLEEEILDRKFIGRIVEIDLAKSLWLNNPTS